VNTRYAPPSTATPVIVLSVEGEGDQYRLALSAVPGGKPARYVLLDSQDSDDDLYGDDRAALAAEALRRLDRWHADVNDDRPREGLTDRVLDGTQAR